MNKHQFQADQFVADTHLNGMQDKNEAYIEKYCKEVVSIDGFVFEGLDTVASDPVSMTVRLNIGSAWKIYKNIVNYAAIEQVLDASDETNPRIDLIAFKYKTGEFDPTNVQFKNPVTGEVYVELKNISLKDWIELVYVKGTPAAEPVAPEIPADCLGSSNILVEAGVTSIAQAKITDIRVSKPDFLVASHRTQNPIDHPPKCIFDLHIADGAAINLSKLHGVDFSSLYELLKFATDIPMVGSEEYSYNMAGRLETITYTGRGVIETFFYDEITGKLTKIELTNDTWKFTETYTFESNKLKKVNYTLEALP